MKSKIIVVSYFVVGFCQASQHFSENVDLSNESDDEIGLPMMTPSPSFESLAEVLAEGDSVVMPLHFKELSKKIRKRVMKISPRTDDQFEAEEAAIKRAKGYGAIEKKYSAS